MVESLPDDQLAEPIGLGRVAEADYLECMDAVVDLAPPLAKR
jgi:hypothetical protein